MGYGPDSDEEYLESGRKTFQSIRELANEHSASIGDGPVLDWGCSAGRILRHFADAMPGCELWGVDVDDAAIRWAKNHLSPPLRFVTGSTFPHLPFEDSKFSFIYGISVFTHIGHFADAWLLELRRVLQTGGLAIFTVHDERTAQWLDEYLRMPWVPPELDLKEIANHDVTIVKIDSGNWRGTYTFFRSAWIEKEWGRYFDVLQIKPYVEGYQSAVVLRKS